MRLDLKMVILVLLTSGVTIFFVANLIYINSKENILISSNERLNLFADMKSKKLEATMNELTTNFDLIRSAQTFGLYLPHLKNKNSTSKNNFQEAHHRLNSLLLSITKIKSGVIRDLIVFDLNDQILISSDSNNNFANSELIRNKKKRNALFHDFPKNSQSKVFSLNLENDEKFMCISGPIIDFDNAMIGKLVMLVNMNVFYEQLIYDATRDNNLIEMFLINHEKLLVSPVLDDNNAILNRKMTPEIFAAGISNLEKKTREVVYYTSYTGKEVIGTSVPVLNSNWNLIIEANKEQLLIPVVKLRDFAFYISFVVLLIIIIVSIPFTRAVVLPINSLIEGSKIIGAGNLNFKVGTDDNNEIGELSRSFDHMITKLQSVTATRDELYENLELRVEERTEQLKQAQVELGESLERNKNIEILEAVLKTENAERSRISKEIHDGLQQTLTISMLNFQAAKKELQKLSDGARNKFEVGWDSLQESIKESRVIAHTLMPKAIVDYGILPAFVNLIDNMNNASDTCTYSFSHNMEKDSLGDERVEITLYRILQEAMNNIVKYAKASNVNIQLKEYDDIYMLTIEDNGVGFDKSILSKEESGIGFMSMQNRLEAIGGFLEIESALGKGTNLIVQINK